MRILLTGNKGFIGTHLWKKLSDLGYDLVGCDIKASDTEDIRDRKRLNSLFRENKFDTVIHLAALTGVRKSLEVPQDYFETNITGTYYLLKYAQKYGVKKFLSASSSSVYGDKIERELREDMICDDQLSPYAVSKKSGELLCRMFKDLPTIVFRPFTVYGSNGRKDMVVRKMIAAARDKKVFEIYGNGEATRGYTHVDDITNGIIRLIDYEPEDNFEIFNIGGSEDISVNTLVNIVKSRYPDLQLKRAEEFSADTKHTFADIGRMKAKVNWQPNKKFEEEILRLCE